MIIHFQNVFIRLPWNCVPSKPLLPFLHPARPWCLLFCSLSLNASCKQIRVTSVLCVWLTSLSIILSEFVHAAAWVRSSFLFKAEGCSLLAYTALCCPSVFWRPFGLFPSLDCGAQLWPRALVHARLCESLLQSLGCLPRSGTAGSYRPYGGSVGGRSGKRWKEVARS